MYGKTSDHVLGLRAVLMGGDILDTQAVPVALAETLGNTPSTVGRIYNTVYQRCKAQRDLIIDKFPNSTASSPDTICVTSLTMR